MIIEAVAAVHTTGINWASVLTISATVIGALGIIIAGCSKYISKQLTHAITDAIYKFQISVVNVIATRLAVVETKVDLLLNTKDRDKSND